MRLLILIIPAIFLVYITGGSLKWLVNRPLRLKWLVLTALFIQIIIFSGMPVLDYMPSLYIGIIHIISYLLLLAFIMLNVKVAGIAILGLGTLSNAIVIIANGGFMPNPLVAAGEISKNIIGISPESRLLFLSDILAAPEWLPLPSAFSIGDVLVVIGMFVYLLINSRKPKSVSAATQF